MSRKRRNAEESGRTLYEYYPTTGSIKHVDEVKQLVSAAIYESRSGSAVLCGPRGCGKSMIVEQALSSFQKSKKVWNTFLHVELDGRIHGDPSGSVDEILLQLGSSLKQKKAVVAGSAAEKMDELCNVLTDITSKGERTTGLIIVIDNVDKLIEFNNQRLLYALFDTAHASNFPICVICMTTVLEIMEKMEKRVRSRFSHRIINVAEGLFADFAEFKNAILSRARNTFGGKIPADESEFFTPGLTFCLEKIYDSCAHWQLINQIFHLARAFSDNKTVAEKIISATTTLLLSDSSVTYIRELPLLHLTILLCCYQYVKEKEENDFNFEIIEEVYKQKKLATKHASHLIANAFGELEKCGLIQCSVRIKHESWRFMLMTLSISHLQLQQAIKEMEASTLPEYMKNWCKELLSK